ncbi:MAG TPA: MarR family transcriptional regulator [Candidatus Woesebacteria bacterium]|nr:MarR family transcriptional regulator [Candidatus Woesebacteria bacterium]
MLKNAFQKLVGTKEHIKTYELIRLQAKTYRSLKNYFNTKLEDEQLSSLEWSVLGLLEKNKNGLRFIEIAQHMGVEPPFITELITQLEKQKLVKTMDNPEDKRAKIVQLTEKGIKKLNSVETNLEENVMNLFSNISANEWQTYRSVMEKIAGMSNK